jgi:phosphatidylglycerol---prolipoprotein diacylglyceryl transferase
MPAPPDPVAFTIPFIDRPVFWYGLMVTLGTLAGAFVADREARRRGHNPDHVWNALILVMVFGLIGARLYHVISTPTGSGTSLQYYMQHPAEIVSFWNGGLRGLGIFGAMAGGVFGLWLYTKWAKLSFAEWADIGSLGLPLGQAIGRWGNYFNQELYGYPTKLPWGVPVATGSRLPQFQSLPADTRFHPTFLYESLWCLLVFFVLMYINRVWGDRLRDGDIALMYLILYGLGRYLVELERPDAWTVGGIPTAQVICVLTMLLAALCLLVRHGVIGPRRAPVAEV